MCRRTVESPVEVAMVLLTVALSCCGWNPRLVASEPGVVEWIPITMDEAPVPPALSAHELVDDKAFAASYELGGQVVTTTLGVTSVDHVIGQEESHLIIDLVALGKDGNAQGYSIQIHGTEEERLAGWSRLTLVNLSSGEAEFDGRVTAKGDIFDLDGAPSFRLDGVDNETYATVSASVGGGICLASGATIALIVLGAIVVGGTVVVIAGACTGLSGPYDCSGWWTCYWNGCSDC